jgi:hypothetical protein
MTDFGREFAELRSGRVRVGVAVPILAELTSGAGRSTGEDLHGLCEGPALDGGEEVDGIAGAVVGGPDPVVVFDGEVAEFLDAPIVAVRRADAVAACLGKRLQARGAPCVSQPWTRSCSSLQWGSIRTRLIWGRSTVRMRSRFRLDKCGEAEGVKRTLPLTSDARTGGRWPRPLSPSAPGSFRADGNNGRPRDS